jgi:hypothetical protein
MTIARTQAEQLGNAGVAALQRGDAAAARAAFEQMVQSGVAGPQVRLLLAQSCRLLGDDPAECAAIDAVLAEDPANIPALLMRGSFYRRGGDRRAATSFYRAALDAAKRTASLAPTLAAELERASAFVADSGREYQAHLERALEQLGVDAAAAGPRFGEALDILFARRQIYLQQPSVFYFPGLPQKQFYDSAEFDWAADIEAAAGDLRAELLDLIDRGAEFRPYVEPEEDRPHRDFHGMNGDPNWSAFYLWKDGAPVEENAVRCPRTMAALERVPQTSMKGRTPSALFSMLQPGTHIPPHHGMLNTRLICHLPLVVPPGCWLRVGNETRLWDEGKLLIFDDSIEHEAQNPADQLRVILLFDVWRPELDESERRSVAALFEAIDAFGLVPATA